jgi:hypothetical protein
MFMMWWRKQAPKAVLWNCTFFMFLWYVHVDFKTLSHTYVCSAFLNFIPLHCASCFQWVSWLHPSAGHTHNYILYSTACVFEAKIWSISSTLIMGLRCDLHGINHFIYRALHWTWSLPWICCGHRMMSATCGQQNCFRYAPVEKSPVQLQLK